VYTSRGRKPTKNRLWCFGSLRKNGVETWTALQGEKIAICIFIVIIVIYFVQLVSGTSLWIQHDSLGAAESGLATCICTLPNELANIQHLTLDHNRIKVGKISHVHGSSVITIIIIINNSSSSNNNNNYRQRANAVDYLLAYIKWSLPQLSREKKKERVKQRKITWYNCMGLHVRYFSILRKINSMDLALRDSSNVIKPVNVVRDLGVIHWTRNYPRSSTSIRWPVTVSFKFEDWSKSVACSVPKSQPVSSLPSSQIIVTNALPIF